MLLLFLYGTGMRLGEALRLRLIDVDLGVGLVTIRGTKFYKSRLVPLGRDVRKLVQQYLEMPARQNQHYRINTIDRCSRRRVAIPSDCRWSNSVSFACDGSRASRVTMNRPT